MPVQLGFLFLFILGGRMKALSDSVMGSVPFYDLVGLGGYTEQQIEIASIKRDGYFFRVEHPDFSLSFGYENGDFVLRRNGYEVRFPAIQGEIDGVFHTVKAAWGVDSLKLGANGLVATTKTPYTVPPTSIVRQAKLENLMPSEIFDSLESFRGRVHNCFATLCDKVEESLSTDIYWNVVKDGKKIIIRKPKDETEIQGNLHALLYDQFLAQSIEVIPEARNSRGRLDFSLLANVKGVGIDRIAVEFKHAHSNDLEHGLLSQLPDYMHSIRAKYGIYCVLYFKCDWFDQPKGFDDRYDLELKLAELRSPTIHPVQQNIKVFCIPFTRKKTASLIE
ncbi:hypothetical protein ABH945_002171 [Paraburkholderia sp. GAS333]|uniref:hypothetical protein n=1 Tax=Paraburkholderia sp. GAS333 TaxID=3156279 RepID=UPI003D2200A6